MSRKNDDHIYAVARIRCKERELFSLKDIEQMLVMSEIDSIKRYLAEKGWSIDNNYNDILSSEEKSVWLFMKELVSDNSCFDFLRVQNDFHNLKVSVKSVYSDCDPTPMLLQGGLVTPEVIYKAVSDKENAVLPDYLQQAQQEAMAVLLSTGDGQLCDIIIDKACLSFIADFGNKSKNKVIEDYCEMFVATANIKIAVRGCKFHKTADFLMRCVTECKSLDIYALSSHAVNGLGSLCDYLMNTKYSSSVEYINISVSAFEKWCDNYIINRLKVYKNDPFSIAPLIAYIIAKQREILNVRLVLVAKANGIDESVVRERIRDVYV